MDLIQMEKTGRKVSKEFSQTREVVLAVLKESERARNDDQWLVLCVLQRLGQDIKAEYDRELKQTVIVWRILDHKTISSFETITRCRREIQNDPKVPAWLPTDPLVAAKRGIRAEAVRDYYGRQARG